MITFTLKTHISSRTRYLFSANYKDIMQYCDMKSKPLVQLSKKYNISPTLPADPPAKKKIFAEKYTTYPYTFTNTFIV